MDHELTALMRAPDYRAQHGYQLTAQARAAIDGPLRSATRNVTLTDQGRRWLAMQRLAGDFSS